MLVRIVTKGQGEQVEGTSGQGDTGTRGILSNLILRGFLRKMIYESTAVPVPFEYCDSSSSGIGVFNWIIADI